MDGLTIWLTGALAVALMGQLLTHAHCNDGAIAEYLQYASRET